jgi:uncharacterized protein YjbJ (UPF0337 family)
MGMGSTKDKISGLTKETAGGVTGNDKLRREGQFEQTKGEVKHQASSMSQHAQNAANKATNRVSDAVHRRT